MTYKTMNAKGFKLLILISVILFPALSQSEGEIYEFSDFEIRVVDAETGEPLEGVLMLAYWSILPKAVHRIPNSMEDVENQWKQIKVWQPQEVLSDKEGWIRYEGWQASSPQNPM